VKRFGAIIANSTKDLSAELSLCLADPVSARSLQTRLALTAPSVWARIVWIYRGEEPHTATITKSLDNVLADECLLLRAVFCAVDSGCRVGHTRKHLTRKSSATAGGSERGLQPMCFHNLKWGIKAASG
jgi:hypothetical protein